MKTARQKWLFFVFERRTLRHDVQSRCRNRVWDRGCVLGSRAVSQELIKLGNRIRDRRQEMCLSQEKVAEKAGISTNTVSRIEGGQSAMSIEIFMKLVQVLGVDANNLLGGAALPADEDGQCGRLLRRVQHMGRGEQRVVLQTMEALVEALGKRR